jgi:biopolymer transport protein ExbD
VECSTSRTHNKDVGLFQALFGDLTVSRRKRKHQDDGDKAEIDLTPMLDVVFIMLIFFIVTASFVKESTLNVNVPENSNAPPPPPSDNKTILIVVDSANDVFIDGRRVDIRSVRSLIAQKAAANPGGGVVVRAHENSNTETYIKIADASRDASVFDISLVPYKDTRR